MSCMGVDSSMCSRTDWQMGNSGKCQMDQFIFSPVGLSKWYYVFSKIIIICLVKRVLKKNMGRCVRNAGAGFWSQFAPACNCIVHCAYCCQYLFIAPSMWRCAFKNLLWTWTCNLNVYLNKFSQNNLSINLQNQRLFVFPVIPVEYVSIHFAFQFLNVSLWIINYIIRDRSKCTSQQLNIFTTLPPHRINSI